MSALPGCGQASRVCPARPVEVSTNILLYITEAHAVIERTRRSARCLRVNGGMKAATADAVSLNAASTLCGVAHSSFVLLVIHRGMCVCACVCGRSDRA